MFEKVTAFVTRAARGRIELLVFDHPIAGTQLPAGSVEVSESPDSAAQREVAEETGLTATRIVAKLATAEMRLPANQRIVMTTEQLVREPRHDAASAGVSIRRGLTVRAESTSSDFTFIVGETFDLNRVPPQLVDRVEGWIASRALGSTIIRHHYHLVLDKPAEDSWRIESDGHVFRPHWVPLLPAPKLVKGQDAWLDLVYAELLKSPEHRAR
jgi:8-oxo-dGTP pyrophosphatase MutT (NUDIX family)